MTAMSEAMSASAQARTMSDESPAAPPPPEVIYVKTRRIACDGGGALGHPIVWYSLEDGEAECGYCDRKFVYDPEKAGS
ncbi:Uncharacterized conserved protein, contains Zn-finger domain [Amphiplicatus metriothermophilus]|uniref:Uncharacterized conserved protein, contains Zn-finger domain n=2 Tax=Amphiplicatus metriothermophilus TaxID=1519374 RepID=A0A239PIP6_9PROT|nr:Uncharacterized conserved protein, contains Zn-finger domain [Amphiplicatus metriothermophilus]